MNKIVSVKMSKSLHRQAKSLAAEMGVKLQDVIDGAVELALSKNRRRKLKGPMSRLP